MIDLTTFRYFETILVIVNVIFVWQQYLAWRQYRKLFERERPAEIQSVFSQEEFDKARSYGFDKARFSFISGTFDHLLNMVVLVYFALPWFWNVVGDIMFRFFGLGREYQVSVFY